jgi:hypothetical protein
MLRELFWFRGDRGVLDAMPYVENVFDPNHTHIVAIDKRAAGRCAAGAAAVQKAALPDLRGAALTAWT